jgi:hypothetical protein
VLENRGLPIMCNSTSLSETDIHYITGFLYVVSRREDITVILGERVFDEASESSRDVDVVIATAGNFGLAAVEVKDEGRPLHVGIVEGICQKFRDMPSITDRTIVSASGYTGPSLKKAIAHGVRCLTIVRGKLPSFATIDLSRVSEIPVSSLEWREGPFVHVQHLSEMQRAELSENSPVRLQWEGQPTDITTFRELVDRIVGKATAEWPGPEMKKGLIAVALDVEVADRPIIALKSGSFSITEVRVTGVVEWVSSAPIASGCYLATPEGEPVAGTVLIEIRSGLLGMEVSATSQELRTFHIPHPLRRIRPLRQRIFSGKVQEK